MPWLDRGRVHGEVPVALHTGSLNLEGGKERGGSNMHMTGKVNHFTRMSGGLCRPPTVDGSH